MIAQIVIERRMYDQSKMVWRMIDLVAVVFGRRVSERSAEVELSEAARWMERMIW